jgi:hypothetical protein
MTYGGTIFLEEALPNGKVFLEALEHSSLEVVKTAAGKASIVNVLYKVHCTPSSTLQEIADAFASELVGSEVHKRVTILQPVSFIMKGAEISKFGDKIELYNVSLNDHIYLVCKEETLPEAKGGCCVVC